MFFMEVKNATQSSPFEFDDLSRLDKPNIDFIATLALNDARLALSQAYVSEEGKRWFIGSVEALLANSLYYWLLDTGFNERIMRINEWRYKEHESIPPDYDRSPETGRSRLAIEFEAAKLKYSEILISITKSTKGVPYIDNA